MLPADQLYLKCYGGIKQFQLHKFQKTSNRALYINYTCSYVCVCKTLLLVLWEEHILSMCAHVLKGEEVTGRYMKLHEEELHNSFYQTLFGHQAGWKHEVRIQHAWEQRNSI